MTTGLAVLSGMSVTSGLCLIVLALVRRVPRLGEALAALTDETPETVRGRAEIGSSGSRSDRVGAWLYRVTPIPLTAGQRQTLQVRGTSIAEFYADKFVLALLGLLTPTLLLAMVGYVRGGLVPALPAVVGLVGGVVGYFIPDLTLRTRAGRVHRDATYALLTYIDLVTLERLANASTTQALHNAARVSDVALFVRIRRSLERAQLEQQSPYAELRRLAEQLGLPELGDLVDVMQLEESGASLAGSLRARVRELRNAHLAREQREADAVSESMTIFMALPALIFALFFIVPPLLRIVAP